jgi:lysine 2,3-aminomutase
MLLEPRSHREFPAWAGATDDEWSDWKWQFRNRLSTPEQLENAFPLTTREREAARRSRDLFRLGITPHWATLIDPADEHCPMRLQAIPRLDELSPTAFEREDPLAEEAHSPVPGLVHRYPDRVLLLVTHECPLYCRYCTRRRIVGDQRGTDPVQLLEAIDYIRRTPAVRDVVISGGEPLGLSDRRLEQILALLRSIPHVEIIRLGTRAPVVLPQRITADLVSMLRRFHPIWLNTHFNHPLELTPPATRVAMERIVDAGIPTGNQTVLLRGVNDCPVIMRRLMHELVKVRCRPYYLYSCDHSQGLGHFRVPVETGLEILESLWGHTSGLAIPVFVVDAPGGGGKIPLLPNYRVSDGVLRNYEGRHFPYADADRSAHLVSGTCRSCGTDHAARLSRLGSGEGMVPSP